MAENRFVMVSEWMANGNINEFVKTNIRADRLKLVCVPFKVIFSLVIDSQMITVAERRHKWVDLYAWSGNNTWRSQGGMCSNPPVALLQFSLPGPKANILINHNGHACLADFSLLTIISDQRSFLASCREGGSTRWMSPELFDPEKFGLKESRPTKESDCYALGMVIYEVLSGQTPFTQHMEFAVIRMVLAGERPGRPRGEEGTPFTDSVWEVLELCWKYQPGDRINAKAILRGLEGNPRPLRPSYNVDGDVETDSDGQSYATASDRGMFSPFHPRLIFDYPRGILDPPTIYSENRPLVPPHGYPPGGTNPMIPPQKGSRKEGWIGRLARNAREVFRATTRKLRGPWRAKRASLR
jgi:hypothetical protein